MKKWIVLTSVFFIGLIVMGYNYVERKNEAKDLQSAIDAKFRAELNKVYGTIISEMNDYTYRSFLANLSSAASISDLTSFEDQNDDLDISLYNLFISLREEKSKDKVLARADELRDAFSILVTEPANKEATDQIIEITDETFFND